MTARESRREPDPTFTLSEFGAYIAAENDLPVRQGFAIARSIARIGGIAAPATEDRWLEAFHRWELQGGWAAAGL